MRLSSAVALTMLLVPIGACSHGGGASSTSMSIGAAGGTLNATGALAGVVLTVPAGALGSNTTISATQTNATPAGGFSVTGVAVQFGPDGTLFNPAATLTLPYDPGKVPAGANAANILVEHRSSTGAVTQLLPTSVDTTNHTVTLSISGFSSYWTSVPTPGNGGESITIADYLSFAASGYHSFEFENGTYIETYTDPQHFPQPPFPVLPYLVLAFLDPAHTTYENWALTRDTNGDLLQHGIDRLEPGGSFEETNDTAGFLPAIAVTGMPATSEFDYRGYDTPNYGHIARFGHTQYSVVVTDAGQVATPAGTFDDVIQVAMTWNAVPAESGHDTTTLYLARDVGPVMYQFGGGPLVHLESYTLAK